MQFQYEGNFYTRGYHWKRTSQNGAREDQSH